MQQGYSQDISDQELQRSYWLVTHYKKIKKELTIALGILAAFLILFGAWRAFTLNILESKYVDDFSQSLKQSMVVATMTPARNEIKIESVGARTSMEGFENGFALVSNPNDTWYVRADLIFLRGDTEVRRVPLVLLPSEMRYIVGTGIPLGSPELTVRLANESWHFISESENPLLKQLQGLKIENISFSPSDKSKLSRFTPISKISFDIKNQSIINFWEITIPIILKDNGVVVAVGNATLGSLDAGQTKRVESLWFVPLQAANEFDIRPIVDIVDPSSLKKSGR